MSSTSHHLINELRANVVELSAACPLDRCNPEDCPLFAVRKMGEAGRLQWLNALAEEDLVYLAAYHETCLTTKMESRIGERSC
jgi:hypothetical protein